MAKYIVGDKVRPCERIDGVLYGSASSVTVFESYEVARNAIRRTRSYAKRKNYDWAWREPYTIYRLAK